MKRTIFLLLIIIVICYFQYEYINTINNSYQILQADNPNKGIFENMIQEKLISIFTNIKFKNIKLDDKSIKEKFYYYNLPLTIKKNYSIINEKENKTNLLVKQNNYRRLFYIVKGTKRFFIFNYDQSKYLYSKNGISFINFFKQDLTKYPLVKKAKYIEIICRENTLLYIPYGFYFTYVCDSDTTTIDFHSESIFSYFLNYK